MDKTFLIHSFGCKVNQEEGEELAALFTLQGWQEAVPGANASLYIVNTCAVTQMAEKKARSFIRRLRREHPGSLLVVTGCYAQVAATKVAALPSVDIIAGLHERANLPALVEQRLRAGQPLIRVSDIAKATAFQSIGPAKQQKRARAYLKIEDGCGQFCHYCIIPSARGPVRSLPLANALAEARELLDAGHRELVLSGIHIGAYGEDLGVGEDLPTLIEQLLGLSKNFRLRLGSLEPRQFSAKLLRLWQAEPRICPHLHIPLQSGSDPVLAAMNRNYRTADYAALLEELRALRPGCAITSDVMTGYPGETAADFAATLDFCAQMTFSRLHVFPYSKRPGTVAATLPQQVPQAEKAGRAALLLALGAKLAEAYARSCIGSRLEYLHEQEITLRGQTFYSGHSGNYLPLALAAVSAPPESLLMVRAKEYRDGYLLCEPLNF